MVGVLNERFCFCWLLSGAPSFGSYLLARIRHSRGAGPSRRPIV